MSDERLEALSKIPIFSKLSARQLRKILTATSEDRYDEGPVILREGANGQTLFVVMEGTARVEHHGTTVGRRSAGSFFGEISMIDRRPRAATVIAETPMRCVVLYHEDLRKIVASESGVAWAMLEALADEIRESKAYPVSDRSS